MIMLTVTKPRRKLRRILQGAGLLLLLLAVVPGLYHILGSAGAMSMFASGTVSDGSQPAAEEPKGAEGNQESNQASGGISDAENMDEANMDKGNIDEEKVGAAQQPTAGDELTAAGEADGEPADDKDAGAKPGLWQALRELLFGREPQVEIYQNLG